jgi:hypothetical protein
LSRLLVATWHSRLPEITNWQTCEFCFGAEFDGNWFAVAMWGNPVAREFNGRGYIELRRFAINNESPKFTASRMLAWMLRQVRAKGFVKAISYQDTDVHNGTIYKASGWKAIGMKKNIGTGWQTRNRPTMQSAADKIRWEYNLNGTGIATSVESQDTVGSTPATRELFADIASTNGSDAEPLDSAPVAGAK